MKRNWFRRIIDRLGCRNMAFDPVTGDTELFTLAALDHATKWDAGMRKILMESVGFDPDNPMVKMEISRILRRGYSSPGGFGDMRSFGASPQALTCPYRPTSRAAMRMISKR